MKEILLRELLHLSRSLGEDLTPERQLELWVGGQSVHNTARDECCPDFSCCMQEMLWTVEKRKEFAEAFIDENFEKTDDMMVKSIESLMRREFPNVDVDVIKGELFGNQ
jgi:hypothetical protein